MGFMSDEERTFSRAVSELALANPFLPERIAAERKALGEAFIETGPVWHARPVPLDTNRNVQRIAERVGALVAKLRERLDRKSTRLNSSHQIISYAVFCLKKKKKKKKNTKHKI